MHSQLLATIIVVLCGTVTASLFHFQGPHTYQGSVEMVYNTVSGAGASSLPVALTPLARWCGIHRHWFWGP